MSKIMKFAGLIILVGLISSTSCGGGGGTDIVTPPGKSATYVGSEACASCHGELYNLFLTSGHPYKLNKVENGRRPEFPYTTVPQPPAGYSWADVSYVIGGYGWKARFIGLDGYIITGDANGTTQYNLQTRQWVPYHPGEQMAYDCGSCHTTGYSPDGHQDGLPGIIGRWAEEGIGCEACHGPGSNHVNNPSKSTINRTASAVIDPDKTCSLCHVRDNINVIDAKDGFIQHHEQSEEILQSPHNNVLDCTSCHNPHAGVTHRDTGQNPGGGLVSHCSDCHELQAAFSNSNTMKAAGVTCEDCHMPPLVKSATGNAEKFKGDISTHLFTINVDADAPQFNAAGTEAMPYITIQYACQHCHIAGGSASVIPLATLEARAEDYHKPRGAGQFVGSATCASCHSSIYEKFILSGHPFKLNKIETGQPPEYPFSAVPNPPAGFTWSDVTYVIGGFGWKARFIGLDGYIITGQPGDGVQYNLATQGWVEYHPGEKKPYDCGACHTTGYNPEGHQEDLEGIIGTWSEPGVQCEACHGAGGAHLNAPSALTINMDMAPEDACANCHIRGDINIIDAKGGFTDHHEQYEEMLQSPHAAQLECSTCHDPHASTRYKGADGNPYEGLRTDCTECHADQAAKQKSANMQEQLVCMDCHMPPMVKSAVGDASTFTGDVPGHLWRINIDPAAPQFSSGGTVTNPYVTLSFACQRCHRDGGEAATISLTGLAAFADDYHESDPIIIGDSEYVGSETCSVCHEVRYQEYIRSGHPWILNPAESGLPPMYPYSSVPNPPPGYSWNDVKFVIGGFGWKARFINSNGYIITGQSGSGVQYNLSTHGWVEYFPGQQLPYDCGSCHSTGYSPQGHQDDLPGIVGTWSEPGVGCEACHGPGKTHVSSPSSSTINLNMDPGDACAMCHIRNNVNVIDASGGFIQNHEQFEEFLQSPHSSQLECTTCHNPHKSVQYPEPVYNPEQGLNIHCESCHPNEAANQKNIDMINANVSCEDCHMPPMVKSAIGNLATFTADISTHLWKINTDPGAGQFSPDGTAANPYITISYACQRCHITGGGASVLPLGSLATYAKDYHKPVGATDYVGSDSCSACHGGVYNKFIRSGHPNILKDINGTPPVYPYSSVPNPPAGYSWDDISYVIGGFGWKARFIGLDGYIITGDPGDGVQYNLATQGWVDYLPGMQKPYDCGACHATGFSASGHQDGLPGITGTWAEPAVQCEACHGPGGGHIQNPNQSNINVGVDPVEACANCHIRGDINVIDAKGGFTDHHEQYEEMLQSPHNGHLECNSCHDPHASVLYPDPTYNPGQGIVAHCEDCHPQQVNMQKSPAMVNAEISCEDCHMPPMVKSAIGNQATFTGDIAGHLWRINTDAGASQFAPDGLSTNPYVTISYACRYCHIDGGTAAPMALPGLAAFAEGYHEPAVPAAYQGSTECSVCHQDYFNTFIRTGHSNFLKRISNSQAPVYPYSAVPNPPPGYSWNDVTYVIGGFGWKARFIGLDGYIITGQPGDGVQYNLSTQGWVEYNPGEQVPYDCGACHTTGYSSTGHQGGLAGITGTWNQSGVHCEACHGPGGAHVYNPSPSTINVSIDPDDSCALCHLRGDVDVIDAADGFILNHEQYEEFLQSPHGEDLVCSSCHDPHRSALYADPVYNPNKGLVATCEQCHPEQASAYNGSLMWMASVRCVDCHMPQMVKTVSGNLSIFTADMATHLLRINTDAGAEQFSPGGTEANGYITVAYACQTCHGPLGPAGYQDIPELAYYSDGFHD